MSSGPSFPVDRRHRFHPARSRHARLVSAAGLFATLMIPVFVSAQPPCTVVDNGTGTVDLPPPGCGYLSPSDVHMIINGLPPGTTIRVGTEHQKFFNVTRSPGGPLGGEVEQFSSILFMHMQGTGELAGYNRNLGMQVQSEIHTAPRTPGSPLQSFDTDMFRQAGQLPPGDPDFDLLRITAGTGFGMPSPGHTTLTRNGPPGSDYNVDSFFDISYKIEFVGAPGGPLAGRMGSTTGTIRMGTGQPAPPQPCVLVDDDGDGTVNLPPVGCGYLSPEDVHRMINGLPPGTTIHIGAEHDRFFNIQTQPGGPLGGEVEQFGSSLTLHMQGDGELQNFTRQKQVQVNCEVHTAPRMPGQPVQSFDTDMFRLGGQLPPGDPDFDLLQITAGTGFGMPSPGHTTLTRLGPEAGPPQYNVDSFFDVFYEIEFVGRPGGPLGGMMGSTTGTIRMQTGNPPTTGIAEESAAPAKQSQILVNRPDPFNPSTMIEFVLAKAGMTQLEVYDASGRLVRRLIDQDFPAGRHEARWDGLDTSANKVVSGTYFIKLKLDGKAIGTEKATVVK